MATNTTRRRRHGRRAEGAATGPVARRLRPAAQEQAGVVGLVLVIAPRCSVGIFGPFLAPWPYQVQDLTAVFANGNRPLPPLLAEPHPRHRPARPRPAEPPARRRADQRHRRVRRPDRHHLHRRADRRHRRLVRRPDGQLPDALHRRHLRLPRPAVHHPAVGGLPRDGVRPGARRPVPRVRRDRAGRLGDRRPARPRPDAVAQGDGVRRGGQGDRRVGPEDRDPAPAAQRDGPDHRRHHAGHPGARSSPRRRWPTSASASSRRAHRGAASSPRARSSSARSRTSSSSRRSASPWR